MKVSLWAEIRRLHEIEKLTGRAIARRLHCCDKTVSKALAMASPPTSASEPGEAMQVDWGDCGSIAIGQTMRRVSVFVAVLCHSRMCYIEFSLSQRKADFYRGVVHALEFFQGSPRKLIVGNRYSVPPTLARKPLLLRANAAEVRILDQGKEVARHARCYEKGQLIRRADDRLAALKMRKCRQAEQYEEEFDALGPAARQFHLKLLSLPVKASVHLRRLLGLVRLYGRKDVLEAIGQALQYQTCDAAYVETLLLQQRRRRELPSPTPLQPKRRELIEDIHLEEPDPARYDRFCGDSEPQESPDDHASP